MIKLIKQNWQLVGIGLIVALIMPLWLTAILAVLFWVIAFNQKHGLIVAIFILAAYCATIGLIIGILLKYILRFIF